ncbi:MAG: beta-ketoacyl synthase N-terminal-like domain-containing protein [Chloroflexota bacterium]
MRRPFRRRRRHRPRHRVGRWARTSPPGQPGRRRQRPAGDRLLGPDATRTATPRARSTASAQRLDGLQGGPPHGQERGVRTVAAAKRAAADARARDLDASNAGGRRLGSGAAIQGLMASAIETLKTRPKSVSPFFIANMLPDTASGQIAIELGAKGPNMCVVTACSTGTNNIGEAAEGIRRGDYHTVITGSTETPLYEVAYVGFSNMRGMGTPREGRPLSDISRPYDRSRDGFVLGEGAGALVLEDYEIAKARGARMHAEVVGYGCERRVGPRPAGREGRGHRVPCAGRFSATTCPPTRSTSSTPTAPRRPWATC